MRYKYLSGFELPPPSQGFNLTQWLCKRNVFRRIHSGFKADEVKPEENLLKPNTGKDFSEIPADKMPFRDIN